MTATTIAFAAFSDALTDIAAAVSTVRCRSAVASFARERLHLPGRAPTIRTKHWHTNARGFAASAQRAK